MPGECPVFDPEQKAILLVAGDKSGGSEKRFIRYMNEKAKELGLVCTRFTTPSGIKDAGNHSCAGDLAAIARGAEGM